MRNTNRVQSVYGGEVKPLSELLAEVEPVDRTGLVCLVPREGSSSALTCHENTLCDCQVLEIADRLDKLKAIAVELAKALEFYNQDVQPLDCGKRAREALTTARIMLGDGEK